MSGMKVTDVLIACDTVECGYQIVELADGRFAFVWGNVLACVGSELPKNLADSPLEEKGVEVFGSYEEAEKSYRNCAEALRETGSRAGDEMMAVLSE